MKKTIVGFGLAVLLVASLIAGCGGGGGSSSPGPTPTSGTNEIVINSTYTANLAAATLAEKYANSYKISGATLSTATVPNSTTK
jgi:ABC-type glycerol-3-phosphate transport system substrate-binding protein